MRRSRVEMMIDLLKAVKAHPEYSLSRVTMIANVNAGLGVKYLKRFAKRDLVILHPWRGGKGCGQSAYITVYGSSIIERWERFERELL